MLLEFFNAYGINYLGVSDVVGDRTELNAYNEDARYIILPMEDDEAGCIDGWDYDKYLQAIFDYVCDKFGAYSELGGEISRRNGGLNFQGYVTRNVNE